MRPPTAPRAAAAACLAATAFPLYLEDGEPVG
jgi:hypothetical protein